MLRIGNTHTSKTKVTPAQSAETMGSGNLPVFATPALVALMENAAMLSVASLLATTESTVGSHIDVKHLAPTSIGATVSATALLEKIEGRKLTFQITAHEGDKKIGTATHIRYIIDVKQFLGKI